MLTPVTAPPVTPPPVAASVPSPSRTVPPTQIQKPGAPASTPQTVPPKGGNSYGEEPSPFTFEGLLHRVIVQQEEPAPAPIARFTKPAPPEVKPAIKGRAIGGVLPTAVHEDKAEPLPLTVSVATPVAIPIANPASSTRPELSYSDPAPRGHETAPKTVDTQQPAPSSPEAFSVRVSTATMSPSAAPRQAIPIPEQIRTLTAPASPVSAIPAAAPIPFITVPAQPADFRPALTHSPISVTSIESVESPAPVTAPTTPVRDLALHLPGTNGVEVRMTERSGEVRVEVRTGDREFTQDLRDNLHELVSGLERKGFAAEVSHPGEPLFARAGQASSSNDSPSDGQGGAFAREQEQKQQRQPDQKFDGRSPKARAAQWSETLNLNLETRNQ